MWGISEARYITFGDAARQRAEEFAAKHGGIVARVEEVYKTACDEDTVNEGYAVGYAVVGRIKHKVVRCGGIIARLA